MPGHRKSECRRNLNDRMKDNMAALAQTMSLFGQKEDNDQDTHYNYSEEDDNESYEELGFLAMNVAGRDNGESKRMERCQRNIYYAKSTCGGLYIDSSDDERKGDAPFSDHARNFLPIEVPTTIAIRRKTDTYGLDMSLKGSSGKDTIIDQTAESPGEAYWKSQVQKGQFSLAPLA